MNKITIDLDEIVKFLPKNHHMINKIKQCEVKPDDDDYRKFVMDKVSAIYSSLLEPSLLKIAIFKTRIIELESEIEILSNFSMNREFQLKCKIKKELIQKLENELYGLENPK